MLTAAAKLSAFVLGFAVLSALPATAQPVGDTDLSGYGDEVVESGGASASYTKECTIGLDSASGLAPETAGDFVESFPKGTKIAFSPYATDGYGDICLIEAGAPAFCAMFESSADGKYDPKAAIVILEIFAPQCRTAEGIGPGSSVVDAVTAYGLPEFNFNYSAEGIEGLTFENGPETMTFFAAPTTDKVPEPVDGISYPNTEAAGDWTKETCDEYGTCTTTVVLPNTAITEVDLYVNNTD
jgi:hypothetical protein